MENGNSRRPSIHEIINEILPEPREVPIYGSASSQTAVADLDVIFPEQETVAVIKPNAFQHKETIVDKIKDLGFNVKAQKEQVMNQELFEAFYKQHQGQEFYENLKEFMMSGPSVVLLLSERNAISNWKEVIGPTDPSENTRGLRSIFGSDTLANGLHGTSNNKKVQELVLLFFTERNQVTASEERGEESDQDADSQDSEN